MNAKTLVVVLFIAVVIFGTGCSSNPRNEEGDVDFRTGSTGFEMRFMQGTPPATVYEGDVLPISIEMFNRGTSEIPPGKGRLFLAGYDEVIINNKPWEYPSGNLPAYGTPYEFSSDPVSGELMPKTQFNTEGGYKVVEFSSAKIVLPQGTTTYNIPLMAYACYAYSTLASANVCFDPQPHRTMVDKPCTTNSVVASGTQGAPVAVSSVNAVSMMNQVKLTITISNVGGGDIVDADLIEERCPTSFAPADINVVYVDYVKIPGLDRIPCQPGGRIKLTNGNGKIVCTAPVTGNTAYMEPVEIKLSYGYRTFIRQNVQVRAYH